MPNSTYAQQVLMPNCNFTTNSAYTQQYSRPTVPIPNITLQHSSITNIKSTAHITNISVGTNITNIKSQQTLPTFSRNKHYEHSVATNITNIQSQQTLRTLQQITTCNRNT